MVVRVTYLRGFFPTKKKFRGGGGGRDRQKFKSVGVFFVSLSELLSLSLFANVREGSGKDERGRERKGRRRRKKRDKFVLRGASGWCERVGGGSAAL